MGEMKQIKVFVNNLYNLYVENFVALSAKGEKVEGRNAGESWHIIFGHLHLGALKVM